MTSPVAPATCTLTARLVRAGTVTGNGSLSTSAPLGMVTEAAPPKVTSWLEPGTSAAPEDCLPR